ncbi:MAG: molybdopterin-binding protein [Nitrospirae bacterium]|nr:molybdopterin-binding protein [Nitrospirota bacterium]
MLGREDAVSVAEAQRRMAEKTVFRELPRFSLPLEDSYGRVLAQDVFSPENLPSFARSTVDGFAVSSSDTFGASESIPAYLDVVNEVFMGKEADFALKKGSAARMPTGGMLPAGADAVVMLEHVQSVNDLLIEVLKPVAPGENVISVGEDIKKGELMLGKGHLLRAQDVAALAGVGLTEATVFGKPAVSIISTGDEIVRPGQPLLPGQVRDINSFNLAGLVLENGGVPVRKGIFKDDYDEIRGVVAASVTDSQLVIITGGSSVGTMDMTAKIIRDLGSPGVLFHGVTLKPGKPTIGGVVNGVPLFGLPGHPAAVTVCFDLFVEPVLRILSGLEGKEYMRRRTVKARMAKNVSSGIGKEEHLRVAVEERTGELWAVPILGKSGLIRTLVRADGTVAIPAQARGIEEGEVIEVRLF